MYSTKFKLRAPQFNLPYWISPKLLTALLTLNLNSVEVIEGEYLPTENFAKHLTMPVGQAGPMKEKGLRLKFP